MLIWIFLLTNLSYGLIINPMKELIEISVRSLVEFILRSGDINRKKRTAPENAMLAGSRIHKMIQRRMGPDYRAEVSLAHKV